MDLQALKARVAALETASFCDADKGLRVMDAGIRPLQHGLRLFGVARTVSCRGDHLTVIKALWESRPGEVLVVETHGEPRAVAGELFTAEARRRGLGGMVVDGAVRDSAAVRASGLPVYSRAVHPMAGTAKRLFQTQTPVTCGGVRVEPGDLLYGDDDGVIVCSPDHLAGLLPLAEAIQAKERALLARMAAGESLTAMMNLQAHLEAVARGEESRLELG